MRRLRYFVAVAEELHFTAAARRLHLSGPALSQQIKALERELGMPLLNRDRRSVALTEAGQLLLGHAHEVLARVEAATDAMRRLREGSIGGLSLGVPAALPPTLLPALLSALTELAPQLQVNTRGLSTPQQLIALQAGTLDAGILRELPDDAALDAVAVHRERIGVALPVSHPLAAAEAVPAAALSGEALIWLDRAWLPKLYDQVVQQLTRHGWTPRPVQATPDTPTSLGMVAAGLGWSIKTERHVAEAGGATAGLIWRPLRDIDLTSTAWAAWPVDRVTPPVKHFITAARQLATQQPTG